MLRRPLFLIPLIFVLTSFTSFGQANGKLQIHFMDVGQGDGAALISPGGQVVLFDDGALNNCDKPLSYLRHLGITKIDYHITSHYHSDHIGCAPQVFQQIALPTIVLDRGQSYASTVYQNYVAAAGTHRQTATTGMEITLDASTPNPVTIDIVALNGNGIQTTNENDLSLVSVVHFGNFKADFGGDLSGYQAGDYEDIETSVALLVGEVEVYKVHHHCSRYSTNPAWLATTKPKIGIISVGNRNVYQHPTADCLERLHLAGVRTYWTETGNGVEPDPAYDMVAGNIIVEVGPGAQSFTVAHGGANPDTYPIGAKSGDSPSPPPVNESYSTATTITHTPFSQSLVTRGATAGSSDPTPACGNGSRAKSVWYRFTATTAGTVVADTFGSRYNTLLSVWTDSLGSFTAVACNDDASGAQSQVSFVVTSGSTYYFMVSAVDDDGGTLVLNLSFFQGLTSPIPTANVLTLVPHSAFGGGFLTRLYLANLVSSTNAVTVNRINRNGQLVGSTSATLSSLGTLLIANPESQRRQSLTVEWLAIGSERPLSASVLFDCCASGANMDSAVGVLGQASGMAFTAPFLFQREMTGSQPLLEEGLAIANRANGANEVTIRLLDQNGAQLSTDTPQTIPAFGQTAFTVSQLPGVSAQLAGKNSFLGSLEIRGTQPFAPVYVGNLGGRLFSLPIAASDEVPAGAAVTAIPHFVTGGGYVTRLFVRNLAAANNTLAIQLLNQSGSSASSETPNLTAGQTIERTSGEANRSAAQSTQWIAINSAGALAASVLFDCCSAGSTVTSAVGVLGQAAGTAFLAPFIFQRQTGSQPILVQGLGVANRANATNTITVRVLDQNGTQISSDTLPALPAMGQTAFTVSELTNLSLQLQGRDEFLGLLEITGTRPFTPVYVGNLGGRLFSLALSPP